MAIAAAALFAGSTRVSRLYRGPDQVWPTAGVTGADPTNLWKSPQDVDGYVAANPSLSVIAVQPHAKWVGDWVPNPQPTVSGYATAAAGKTMNLCLYAIPGRDLGGYSGGGFPDRASYLTWVQAVVNGVGAAPAIVVYEPDALGHLGNMSDTARAERVETLRQGLVKLSTAPKTETYIDAAMWLSPTTAADYLVQVGVAGIAGFAVNTSAFNTQDTCYAFGDAVIAALNARGVTGKKYVVDSSRNGSGPLTSAFGPAAQPWLDAGQDWCNPPGRTLGLPPGPVTGHPSCRATLWVKNPGGSDGDSPRTTATAGKFVSTYYGENAPAAGTYWVRYALDMVGTPGTAPTTATPLGQLTGTFTTPDLGDWPAAFGTYSTVNGRARVTCNTDYNGLVSNKTYTLKSSQASTAMYPPTPTGATTAYAELAVESPTLGTRLIARADTAAGTLRFASETGYTETTPTTVTYNATTMRYVRIREAAGTVAFDTSPDGTTWTTRRTTPTPTWVNNVCDLALTAHRDGGTPDYAEFDNVNT